MIKEIKTEKFEGLALLVPDNTYNHQLEYVKYSDGKEYFMLNYNFGKNHIGGFVLWYKDFGGRKKYPKEGELFLLGKSTELTEEQCAVIVCIGMDYYEPAYKNYAADNDAIFKYPFDTAKESFNSLMQSTGANTGTWVILKKAIA